MDPVDDEADKIHLQFNKIFHFEASSEEKHLPELKSVKTSYEMPEFKSMKDELNKVKSKLNELSIEIWSEHTRNMNPAGEIVWRVKNDTKGEFVTQAWCKMYECLCTFELVPKNVKNFNSLHLCEAPGAFVTSLNHYLQLNRPEVAWKWIATTLNPYYEGNCLENMIIDDRFIVQTLANWDFGVDYTGNIMNLENIEHLKEKCRRMNGVNFVTADGSIDCMLTPEDQERHVASLHHAETAIALQVLSPGGSFLLKMFTFYEDSSISLLYLLTLVFQSVDIFKPATSKEGNSEVYVICRGFKGDPLLQTYCDSIIESNFNTNFGLFDQNSIEKDFLKQLIECCRFFMETQAAVIERNLATFEKLTKKDIYRIKSLRYKTTKEFFERYNLRSIPPEKKILSRKSIETHLNLNPRQHVGSYVERKHRKSMCEEEKYLTLQSQLQTFVMEFNFEGPINFSINGKITENPLKPYFGKKIEQLTSSKFVFTPKLRLFFEIVNLLKNSKKVPNDNCEPLKSSNQSGIIFQVNPLSFLVAPIYDFYEKTLASEIIEILISELSSHKNLILQNLLLLSQFFSGLIFHLGHTFFENLYFYNEGAIVLENFKKSEENVEKLKSLRKLIDESRSSKDSNVIVGIVDLKTLFKQNYYMAVIQYNTSLVLQYSMNYLKFYDGN
ncbi:cap-specific mRNA (nucleoside-2'-O-)-methyltransferase 2 [Culicoides brevitarsis]|uniref:cap-specific mRNA (nucleoside-2'-O-)-methyltransferase 2 n=1 Tax=Culicoides brevitarsis TaxID=469753 RepID=UPI00307B699E